MQSDLGGWSSTAANANASGPLSLTVLETGSTSKLRARRFSRTMLFETVSCDVSLNRLLQPQQMSCDTTRTDQKCESAFSGVTSSKNSLRILYISEPWTHGGRIRSMKVLRALQQTGTVEVAMLGEGPRDTECELTTGGETKIAYSFQTRSRPNTGLIPKLKFTFDPRADYPYGWAIVGEGRERLNRCLKDFDLLWFFKQRAADLFPNAVWLRSLIDIDDAQSTSERPAFRVSFPLFLLQP